MLQPVVAVATCMQRGGVDVGSFPCRDGNGSTFSPLALCRCIAQNYGRIREVEKELVNLQFQLKLTSGPKKHALELMRKKIETQTDRVVVIRRQHAAAKQVLLAYMCALILGANACCSKNEELACVLWQYDDCTCIRAIVHACHVACHAANLAGTLDGEVATPQCT